MAKVIYKGADGHMSPSRRQRFFLLNYMILSPPVNIFCHFVWNYAPSGENAGELSSSLCSQSVLCSGVILCADMHCFPRIDIHANISWVVYVDIYSI